MEGINESERLFLSLLGPDTDEESQQVDEQSALATAGGSQDPTKAEVSYNLLWHSQNEPLHLNFLAPASPPQSDGLDESSATLTISSRSSSPSDPPSFTPYDRFTFMCLNPPHRKFFLEETFVFEKPIVKLTTSPNPSAYFYEDARGHVILFNGRSTNGHLKILIENDGEAGLESSYPKKKVLLDMPINRQRRHREVRNAYCRYLAKTPLFMQNKSMKKISKKLLAHVEAHLEPLTLDLPTPPLREHPLDTMLIFDYSKSHYKQCKFYKAKQSPIANFPVSHFMARRFLDHYGLDTYKVSRVFSPLHRFPPIQKPFIIVSNRGIQVFQQKVNVYNSLLLMAQKGMA